MDDSLLALDVELSELIPRVGVESLYYIAEGWNRWDVSLRILFGELGDFEGLQGCHVPGLWARNDDSGCAMLSGEQRLPALYLMGTTFLLLAWVLPDCFPFLSYII